MRGVVYIIVTGYVCFTNVNFLIMLRLLILKFHVIGIYEVDIFNKARAGKIINAKVLLQ